MLEIDFLNVGDGDSILLRETGNGLCHTVLVDAGRPWLDPDVTSLKSEAVYHLQALGVERIDELYLTHLHVDHIGGALNVIRHFPVSRLISPYVPGPDARFLLPPFGCGSKKRTGLCQCLDLLKDIADEAAARGASVEACPAGTERLTPSLTVENRYWDPEGLRFQNDVYRRLQTGGPVDPEDAERAASDRNVHSLIQLFTYRGRKILLGADAYAGPLFDTARETCDIMKVPHHGDAKSVTPELLEKVRPALAVASCQNDPAAKKERPAAAAVRLFLEKGIPFLCTENRELPELAAVTGRYVRCLICDSGEIRCERM